jgi:hypothetical protein
MPSDDTLRRMAEDIINIVVRHLIDEIGRTVFDEAATKAMCLQLVCECEELLF